MTKTILEHTHMDWPKNHLRSSYFMLMELCCTTTTYFRRRRRREQSSEESLLCNGRIMLYCVTQKILLVEMWRIRWTLNGKWKSVWLERRERASNNFIFVLSTIHFVHITEHCWNEIEQEKKVIVIFLFKLSSLVRACVCVSVWFLLSSNDQEIQIHWFSSVNRFFTFRPSAHCTQCLASVFLFIFHSLHRSIVMFPFIFINRIS